MFYIYRIYYNNQIVYIGRTNNIENRIRQHILSGKTITASKISKIEFAKLATEADMNLYELYYILKYKPILNIKDTTQDNLSIELPEPPFQTFYSYLYEQWCKKAIENQQKLIDKKHRLLEIKQLLLQNPNDSEKEILENEYYFLTTK